MIRPAVLVVTLALYCLSGFRMSVDATPLPLPMPMALMAPDFSSRWHLRNDTAAFNLARGLVSHYTFNTSLDYRSGHGTSHGDSSLTRRKYADKIAQLYGFYSNAMDSSSNLRRFAAQSATVDENDLVFQQDAAAELTAFDSSLLGIKTILDELGSDKGLKNYDRTNDLETLLKNVVNFNKETLNAVDVLVYNLPILGPILGPIVYEIKCILDDVLNAIENLTDALINGLQPLLAGLIGQASTTACRSGVILAAALYPLLASRPAKFKMATSMRGLTQFIADIRGARVRELEEKRINKEMANIRKKFKDGNLDGYQRKKYVAKIIFTYILGYKVDVGHMEAVNLISSTKYSEKQIGYLAVTLLMHENSDFLRLVVNSIRKDLEANNEVDNCLALHAIANVGGSEMAEALAEDVHRLLISPTSQTFVKKKAALTLLRLYRKHPEVVPAAEWALRIVSIMDDHDLGVVICVTSLVMALAQDHLDAYAVCYTKAVDRLHKLVIGHEYSATYAYYKVPSPWLQVKLLRLLQYYPPSDDASVRSALYQVLQTIMNNCAEPSKNVQHNNAQHAVLFEAISLAIHIDTNSPLVGTAAVLLARFISSKETNVRRRALDLLYSMCDSDNSELIVGELLRYLRVADYALREEMVLKVAILTEKYATSYKWYVDTILQLISAAGDHDLQEYAAKVAFEHLKQPSAHESLVKVGGYILGEYGHLIANEPGYSPVEQFQLLHSKSQFCVASTRSLLLTTYIKWVNVFPEIRPQLLNIFDRYRHVLDAELQQRACEYFALASRPEDDDFLPNVCEEMPPFPPGLALFLGV
ncbi:hypothetical protein NMY22_g6631 [Coprinellus aureogranulatus]|nr:hypothetical protein NMY22_g6631 [Coprinellus aureogranulatus]